MSISSDRPPRRMQPATGHHTLGTTPEQWIVFTCPRCGRRGEYAKKRLLEHFAADTQMPDLLIKFAAFRGCALAIQYQKDLDLARARECKIHYDTELTSSTTPVTLGKAMHEGWRLTLICERHRQGLKSTKPCPERYAMDMRSLVAALGHRFEIDKLERKLCCPGCCGKSFTLSWFRPNETGALRVAAE